MIQANEIQRGPIKDQTYYLLLLLLIFCYAQINLSGCKQCEVSRHLTVHSVHYTVHNVQFTVYIIQSTVHTDSAHYTVEGTQCRVSCSGLPPCPACVHTYSLCHITLQCTLYSVHYSTVQYSTLEYSTVQYSTVQYSSVQYSTVQHTYPVSCLCPYMLPVSPLLHWWFIARDGCSLQCTVVQCSAVHCSAVLCNTVQCSSVKCGIVHYSAMQYSAVQQSEMQYSECSTVDEVH